VGRLDGVPRRRARRVVVSSVRGKRKPGNGGRYSAQSNIQDE
jgi:hypothetical protein